MMPSFFRFNTAILLRAARAIQHWAEGTVALLESRGEKTGNKSQEKSDGERGSSISSDAAIADSDGAVFPREPAGPPAHWVELVRRHAPELLRPVEANEPELRERAARPEPPILGRGDRLARPTAQDEISEISPAQRPGRVKRSVPQRPAPATPPPAMSEVSDAALESFSGEAETKEKSARAPASAGREPAPPERKPHAPSFLPSHRPTDRSHARRPSPRSDQESVQRQPRKAMARALPTAKAIRAAAIDFSGSQRDLPGRLDQGRPRGGKLRSDSVAVGRRERP